MIHVRPARLALAAALSLAVVVPVSSALAGGGKPTAKPPVAPPKAGATPAAADPAALGATLKDVEKAMTQKRYEAVLAYAKAKPKAEDAEEAWKTAVDLAETLEHWTPLVEHAGVFLTTFPSSSDATDVWQSKGLALAKLGKTDDAKTAYETGLKLYKVGDTHPQTIFNAYQAYANTLVEAGDVDGAKKALDDVVVLFKDDEQFGPQVKRAAEAAMVPLAFVGKEPPEMPEGVKDMAGKDIKYEDFKGKVLLVDFWATWCPPCRAEMPNVVAAYKKWHDKGFEILGVTLDKESAEKAIKEFSEKMGMTWRQYYDGGYWENKVSMTYGVKGIPQTFLVGKDGKIIRFGLRGEALDKALEKLLK